ncbi:YoaK family protein [Nonomuraea fastidiosa]
MSSVATMARRVSLPGLMLALTFATGVVDAVGYLRLDQVFAGNMTGNVVILGMAATGTTDLPVLGPAVALVLFLAGAALGGRVLRTAESGWDVRCTGLLTGVALILGLAALVLVVAGADAIPGLRPAIAASLALAMGMQAATARHLAVKDVTTVVVTSTLTGLAADSRLGAARSQGALRRAAAVAWIILGAAAGAALCQVHEGFAVAVAALVVLAVSALGHLTARSDSHPVPATTGQATPPADTPASARPVARTDKGVPRATGPHLARHQGKGRP